MLSPFNNTSMDILFNEAKIIYTSQSKLQNLIRVSLERVTKKNDICNDNTSLSVHKVWMEFLRITV